MRKWSLWTLPLGALCYWLVIDAAALATSVIVLINTDRPTDIDLIRFAGIAATATAVIVGTSVFIQLSRESNRNPWSVHACYLIAGIMVLPPNLLILLLLGPALSGVLGPRMETHRWLFSTAGTVLATLGARWFLGWDTPSWNPIMLLTAGALLVLARAAIIALGLRLRRPDAPGTEILGSPIDITLGVVAVSVGVLMAKVVVDEPLMAMLAGAPMVLLEQVGHLPQWRRSAQRDSKTGLANAMYWDRLASVELSRARERRTSTAVLLLDMDHFKRVNDDLGHLAGDSVLAAVALLLRTNIRRGDVVGRFGGEEFVILLPATEPAEAEAIAQRVRRSVAALRVPLTTAEGQPHELVGLTASIGVATSQRFGYELPSLLAAADSALLAAKGSGRNLVTMA
ncbi:GGDEF domain-containing protein [Actinoalloteichus hymeniacidonis]|uniref:Diguanylate cyclase (GGDEF) domain-containing protein n=1 Tax=Actinoalloteichus hymeniacidonis TaxID=340345 RepID=A0AAC9HX83_9PSEU|nr:diguanylate cyclase [Actinoalloteichus hymeniacidonis]AOS66155.1 diguanylate cyclase (GGDEF) domain-containing protein [Actinoalloteichus hymeniacidonis]MBB5905742.1 diguanylate cyclase (GGDEF)-like protein [Actinoalloteichus hymeniacidonis]